MIYCTCKIVWLFYQKKKQRWSRIMRKEDWAEVVTFLIIRIVCMVGAFNHAVLSSQTLILPMLTFVIFAPSQASETIVSNTWLRKITLVISLKYY